MLFERIERLRASIFFKLAAFFALSFSISMAVAFLFSYFQLARSLDKANREILISKWRELSVVLEEESVEGLKKFFSEESQRFKNADFMIRILDHEGRTLFFKPSVQEARFDFEKEILKNTNSLSLSGWSSVPALEDEERLDLYTEAFAPRAYLQVGRSNEDREDILENVLFGFTGLSAFFALLSGLLGWFYARSVVRPLRKLTQTILRMESGDLSRRVPLTSSKNEFEDLVRTFNRMADRVENLVQGMKESLDHVSHDIRTPLARMKGVVERALVSRDPSERVVALEDCAENVDEIASIVEQILEISEAEAGTMVLHQEISNVRGLLSEVMDLYEFVALEKNLKLILQCPSDLQWNLDRRRFKRVVGNLLDNAIKYSRENSEIKIAASVENSVLRLSISDQGMGVLPQDLPFIWDRLYRADKSRSSKGSGIGLALVKSLVIAQGGKVFYEPAKPQGSVFSFELPEAGP